MSQATANIINQSRTLYRAAVNAVTQAIQSMNSGATTPAETYAYMSWADTTAGLWKIRNAANSAWITVGPLADLGIQSGAQVVGVATGTADAITLAFTPALTAFDAGPKWWRATGANTVTTPTVKRDGLALKTLVKGNNLALAVADIPGAGAWMCSQYDAGTDKEVLLNPANGVTAAALLAGNIGASRNLKAVLATNGTTAAFTADDVTVGTALSGTYRKLASYSQTLNIGTTGAGGMDTGTAPVSGFVAIYAIAQAGGTTSILGVNATTSSGSIYSGANMPSGYTFSALIGIWPTNATPQLLAGCVFDRKYSYQVFKTILSGVTLTTSYASQSMSSAVPVAARGADYQWADGNGASYFYIAADSVGTAAKGGHFDSDAGLRSQPNGMNSSRVSGGADDVPFITAQTAWLLGLGNVGGTSLYVKAYYF